MDGHRVDKVLVSRQPEPSEPPEETPDDAEIEA